MAVFTFVSPVASAWGETVLGIRVAKELIARGHVVQFAAPRSVCHLLQGTGIQVVPLRNRAPDLRRVVPRLLSRSKSAALVLVDETTWSWTLADQNVSPAFLRRLDVPVVALDVWDVHARGFEWDRLDIRLPKPGAITAATRLRPVPFIRLSGLAGLYNALPQARPTARALRRRLREELGLLAHERLIVITSATWQSPSGRRGVVRRLAQLVPFLIAAYLGRMGDGIRVMHVGPTRYDPLATALGRRYRWSPQLPPQAFERALRAADLFLSLNASSTAAISAVSLGLPVLTGVSSHVVRSRAQADAACGADGSEFMERWLSLARPLPAFAVWPLGFFGVMSRALARNPYRDLLHLTELLDEDQFVAGLQSLIYDAAVRRATRDASVSYCARVMQLPRAADLLTDLRV